MPEEQPLKSFITLKLVCETENVLLIGELEEVEKLCASLHDWERRILGIVDDDGDTA